MEPLPDAPSTSGEDALERLFREKNEQPAAYAAVFRQRRHYFRFFQGLRRATEAYRASHRAEVDRVFQALD